MTVRRGSRTQGPKSKQPAWRRSQFQEIVPCGGHILSKVYLTLEHPKAFSPNRVATATRCFGSVGPRDSYGTSSPEVRLRRFPAHLWYLRWPKVRVPVQ